MGISRLAVAVVGSAAVALAGCGVQRSGQTTVTPATTGISGMVHGGQQPIGFATIQLWTVGTGGDGSPATPMLTKVVQSDANGNFNISGAYSCVNSNATLVYVTAVGGFPATFTANPNLAMMTALGPCTGLGPGTTITINELTTIAAVAALQPYITGYGAVGSGTSDVAALAQAFGLAEEFVDSSTGVSPGLGVPPGMSVPATLINTLGNVVAACVNSGGGLAGTTTGCGLLFTYVKPTNAPAPTDTVGALIDLLANPTNNATNLFNIITSNAPFAGFNMPPASFAIALIPTGGTYLLQLSGDLAFPPTAVGFAAPTQTVTVQNIGTGAVLIGNVSATGTNPTDFGVIDLCPPMLAPGGSCAVQVTATPGGMGPRGGSLLVVSSAVGSPQSVGLSVTGTAPSAGPVTVTSSVSFGVANTLQDVTVSNYGLTPLTIRGVVETDLNAPNPTFYGVPNFSIVSNNCGSILPAQSACVVVVTANQASSSGFTGNANLFLGQLNIDDDASTGPQIVALSSSSIIYLSRNTVGFAAVPIGGSSVSSITVTQEGHGMPSAPYPILGGVNPGDFSYTESDLPYFASGCPTGLGTTGSPYCTIDFKFTPQASGFRSARALFGSSEYVLLTGGPSPAPAGPAFTAVSSGQATIMLPTSPDPYGNLSGESVVIRNTGSTTFGYSAYVAGPSASMFTADGNGCVSTQPFGGCSVGISFNGTALGTYTAYLVVKDLNSTVSHFVTLTGTVAYWPIQVPVTGLTFGYQAIGTSSAAQTVTVADPYGYPVGHVITASLQANSNFTLPQGTSCPASLTQTCSFAVAFAPVQAGYPSEVMTFTDQTSGDLATISLGGTSSVPAISLSPSPLVFATRAVNTTSVALPITVTNTGTATLTIYSVSVSGAVNNNFSETNNCTNVGVNGTCTIGVTFAPTATGTQSATISVVSNAPSVTDKVTVTGTAQ